MNLLRTPATWLACMLAACTPSLDWREVRPDDSGALVLFPCKPASHARALALAGGSVRYVLYACSAGGATWGLGFADLGDPARVTTALAELREQAARNIEAPVPALQALSVPGATPNAAAGAATLSGRFPDGTAVQERMAVFAKGTRVFQATVVSAQLPKQHADTFLDSLRAER